MEQLRPIAAISTPLGTGAIAIVRLSGMGVIDIAAKVLSCPTPIERFETRRMYLCDFLGKTFSDRCMAVLFRTPTSYTGEDVIEFHLHGGHALAIKALNTLIACGAHLADRGEFTRRAYYNSKLTLSAAEGAIALINAQSDSELCAAYSLVSESLNEQIDALSQSLVDAAAQCEVVLDYPEEDLEAVTLEQVHASLVSVKATLTKLLETSHRTKYMHGGIKVALLGRPNVGKSSLLNSIVGHERAIVSNIPGTTRDTVTEGIEYKGMTIKFTDTAGLRASPIDSIERIGIERSRKEAASCDVAVLIIDHESTVADTKEFAKITQNAKHITVYNKCDLKSVKKPNIQHSIALSATTGEGITKLLDAILDSVDCNKSIGGLTIALERHCDCLRRACLALDTGIANIDINTITLDIREAVNCLFELGGKNVNEAIVDSVFKNFCLGK